MNSIPSASAVLAGLWAWPKDVAEGVAYQASRLSGAAATAPRIESCIDNLPCQLDLIDAASGDTHREQAALLRIRQSSPGFYITSTEICIQLGGLLDRANCRTTPIRNRAVRRSLMLLSDRLLPPARPDVSLVDRLHAPYESTKRRYSNTPAGTPGAIQARNLMLLLDGLRRVAQHPQLAGLHLQGPIPSARNLLVDAVQAAVLLTCIFILPRFGRSSPLKALGLEVLLVTTGLTLTHRRKGSAGNKEQESSRYLTFTGRDLESVTSR